MAEVKKEDDFEAALDRSFHTPPGPSQAAVLAYPKVLPHMLLLADQLLLARHLQMAKPKLKQGSLAR